MKTLLTLSIGALLVLANCGGGCCEKKSCPTEKKVCVKKDNSCKTPGTVTVTEEEMVAPQKETY